MNQTIVDSTNIITLIKDIKNTIKIYKKDVEKQFISLKYTKSSLNINLKDDKTEQIIQKEINLLEIRKNKLKEDLIKEKKEYLDSKKNNESLNNQIQTATHKLNNLLKEKKTLENNLNNLENKQKLKIRRKEEEELVNKKSSDLYRKHLGIDILPLSNNNIKIIFSLKKKVNVFLNFNEEEVINRVEGCDIELNKVNRMFKRENSFYSFLKRIREELKSCLR